MISIIIPTRTKISLNLSGILECLENQTFKDFEVIIEIDENSPKNKKNNVSYLRNCGIKKAKGQFIYLFDDDNLFDDDFLENTLKERNLYKDKYKKDIVLVPTLLYRKTNIIQSRGFGQFNYFLSTPIANIDKTEIKMFSGNGIFGPTYIFQDNIFNEKIPFVYEDLYFTYNIFNKGFPIISSDKLKINHMEREKTKLEFLFVGTPDLAYQKGRNRFILVKDQGTYIQKLLFYLFGWFLHSLWLVINVLLYGKGLNKSKIISSLFKGTWDGFMGK